MACLSLRRSDIKNETTLKRWIWNAKKYQWSDFFVDLEHLLYAINHSFTSCYLRLGDNIGVFICSVFAVISYDFQEVRILRTYEG